METERAATKLIKNTAVDRENRGPEASMKTSHSNSEEIAPRAGKFRGPLIAVNKSSLKVLAAR
jgi:hypothetical protein